MKSRLSEKNRRISDTRRPFCVESESSALVDVGVAEAFDGFDDFAQRGVELFQSAHQEAGFLLLDPAGHALQDLVFAQVVAGDAKRLGVRSA